MFSYISSVQAIRRTGILNRIRKNAWPQVFEDSLYETSTGTTIDTVIIFHYLLAMGLLLSVCVLALERIWWRASSQ
jgi:hypothetical protein